MEEIISTVNAEPAANVEPQIESEQSVEPVIESVTEEVAKPQQSKDDNAKYAAIRREAEKKAKDQMISEMYGETHGIHTYSDYQKAIETEKRKTAAEERGVDYNVLEELINDDPRVKQANELLTKREQEQKTQKEQIEFLDYFQEQFKRPFSPDTDDIPVEVFQLAETGVPLLVAYKAVGETSYLKKQLNELQSKLSADETNKKNAESSPGGITPSNTTDSDFISKDVFEANKSDQRWVIKNLEKLTKSRLKW